MKALPMNSGFGKYISSFSGRNSVPDAQVVLKAIRTSSKPGCFLFYADLHLHRLFTLIHMFGVTRLDYGASEPMLWQKGIRKGPRGLGSS